MPDTPPPIVAAQNENKSINNLRALCDKAVANSTGYAEVVLGTRQFGTDKYDLDFDDYTVIITRAKLNKEGYATDIEIRMDSKCRKVILTITPPAIYLSRKVEGQILPKTRALPSD